jgi:hypothetical protein
MSKITQRYAKCQQGFQGDFLEHPDRYFARPVLSVECDHHLTGVDEEDILLESAVKLGISQRELAKRLRLTQPAVSQAGRRGKDLVKSQSYSLFHD